MEEKEKESTKENPTNSKPETKQDKPKPEKIWHVYLLECMDGSYYTGITNDINKRMAAHEKGTGSKYVRRKGFKCLLRTRACKDKSDAAKEEYQIKQLPKYDKLDYFKSDKVIHTSPNPNITHSI